MEIQALGLGVAVGAGLVGVGVALAERADGGRGSVGVGVGCKEPERLQEIKGKTHPKMSRLSIILYIFTSLRYLTLGLNLP